MASKVCVGFLIIFACPEDKPVTVSDFCQSARPEIAKLQRLTEAELKALQRPRKEAILALRRSYKKNCSG